VALELEQRGHDLTPGSRAASDQAIELAARLGSDAVLLHSTASDEVWDADQQVYLTAPEADRGTREPALEQIASRFRAAGITTRVELSRETAWLAVIRGVLRHRIDLVIAGTRSERGHPGPLLGTVAQKLTRKCPCGVWVAKPGSAFPLRCVLAATDLSPVGERVIEYAGFLAAHCGAALHVVHAFQLPLSVQMEGEAATAEFERTQRETRARRLQALVRQSEGAPTASFHVGLTSPSRAILECAERFDPDLVVMGTVSRGGVPGLLVGNTAERLLGRLDCSLLTVKPADFVCPVQPDA
jgi:universal stress protein E